MSARLEGNVDIKAVFGREESKREVKAVSEDGEEIMAGDVNGK